MSPFEPLPFQVTIEKLVPGGRGLGVYGGKVIFVPATVPGDQVMIHSINDRKGYLEATHTEVVVRSPDRCAAPCPIYGTCGGCDFQHMNYRRQLTSKQEILEDALRRIGKLQELPPIRVVDSPHEHYRNRLQIKIPSAGSNWGFYQAASHQIVGTDQCLIVAKHVWRCVQALQSALRGLPNIEAALKGVELWSGDDNSFLIDLQCREETFAPELISAQRHAALEWLQPTSSLSLLLPSGRRVLVFGSGYIHYKVGPWKYRIRNGSFFQVNQFLLNQLLEAAVEGTSGNRAMDLCCGSGFFTLPLTARFASVTAVEMNSPSIEDLQANLAAHQISNCRIFHQDLNAFFAEHAASLSAPDLMLLDPPLTGLPREALLRAAKLAPSQLIYVSCDPATLARDLKIFIAHQYQLTALTLLDLFPQTHHLETVARLKRG